MRNFDQCAPNFRLSIDEATRARVGRQGWWRWQRRRAAAGRGSIARATSSCINFSRLGRLKLHIIKSLC